MGGGEATSPHCWLVLPNSAQTQKILVISRLFSVFVAVHKMSKGGDIIDTQSYVYQLTINAPIDKGFTHERIIEIIRSNFKTITYFCMADEQGSQFHTHVYVVFAFRVRFSMIKKYFPEAHIEKCRGSVSDNVNYIKKSGKWGLDESKQEKKIDETFEEYGIQPPDSKGKRSDMSDLYQMVLDNMTNAEILATNQDYILQIDKLDKIRITILTERYKETVRLDLEVIYISGATGTGKTRGVLESNGYANVYRVTDYLHPFDGYNCQPVICFDEFRSSLKLKEMLIYCDIYPIELPSRYANKFACFKKVYIISNWSLDKQYSEIQKDDEESWKALLRRIHKVIVYNVSGRKTEYQSVINYFDRNNGFMELTGEQIPFD
ncbi:MAG: putative replication protein [Eubacterium sp.]|nr:putative replication protein [Eubacterium sp.]